MNNFSHIIEDNEEEAHCPPLYQRQYRHPPEEHETLAVKIPKNQDTTRKQPYFDGSNIPPPSGDPNSKCVIRRFDKASYAQARLVPPSAGGCEIIQEPTPTIRNNVEILPLVHKSQVPTVTKNPSLN